MGEVRGPQQCWEYLMYSRERQTQRRVGDARWVDDRPTARVDGTGAGGWRPTKSLQALL